MSITYINRFRKWIRQYPTARKFVKFGIVGATSASVSLGVFWLLINQFPSLNLLSKAIGYVMGFFVGFTLNKFWTYIDQTEEDEKYLLKYILVYAVTFVIYLTINFVFDHFLHPNEWLANLTNGILENKVSKWMLNNGPLVSNILAIFINIFLNFLVLIN